MPDHTFTAANDPVDPPADQPGDDTSLGGRIAVAREARGLSVAQLARRVGVATETARNWECDRSEPRVNKLQMLAGVLEVPMLWLLGGEHAEADADFDVNVDETADLARKVERLVNMQQRMATLLFEVEGEVRRLQAEIDCGGIKV